MSFGRYSSVNVIPLHVKFLARSLNCACQAPCLVFDREQSADPLYLDFFKEQNYHNSANSNVRHLGHLVGVTKGLAHNMGGLLAFFLGPFFHWIPSYLNVLSIPRNYYLLDTSLIPRSSRRSSVCHLEAGFSRF